MPTVARDWHEEVAEALAPIRATLSERQMTLTGLADLLGMSRQRLYFYLTGRNYPAPEVVRSICELLDIPLIHLPQQPEYSRAGYKANLTRSMTRARKRSQPLTSHEGSEQGAAGEARAARGPPAA